MDPMFDQVRSRTADLRRVAEDVRRERDLRAGTASQTLAEPRSTRLAAPSASAADAPCVPTGARQAA